MYAHMHNAYTRIQCLTGVRQVGQDALANFGGNLLCTHTAYLRLAKII